MFEKFGEFDSFREINALAENLFNEGDYESIKSLAEENGIPAQIAEAYIDCTVPELCDEVTAAVGKIEIEMTVLKPVEIMADWTDYIMSLCMSDTKVALAVRTKGKSLEGCIAELLKWSFANQQHIDDKIIKAAGVKAQRVTLGIPGMGRAKKIIKDYYIGGKK